MNPTTVATTVVDSGATSGGLVMFWALALLVVGGAITTVMQKNTVTAVMALVATFFGLAGLYLMLSAQFLAVIQVLVYAGAIMTLFVFVVMVLNREEAEPFVWRGWFTKGIGIAGVSYAGIKLGSFLFAQRSPASTQAPPPGWGGVADVGITLFRDYLFPFEALSLMLLVAVIGAVVVARTPKSQGATDGHAGGLAPPESPDGATGTEAHAGSGGHH